MVISILIYTFAIVFFLNIIPIFGPPTWITLSFISFTYPIDSLPLFVFVALSASTFGRLVLTIFSKNIIRNRFLGEKYRKNMNYIKTHLEKRPHFVSILFFIEAFTPLPSDQFFIAYGLTSMKLRYAFVPFILARMITYSFWVYTASELSRGVGANAFSSLSFLSWPAILAEVLILIGLYFFVKVDWEKVILGRKWKTIN